MPPLERAYGRERDPAPTIVVKRINMDAGMVPLVNINIFLEVDPLSAPPLLSSGISEPAESCSQRDISQLLVKTRPMRSAA